MFYLLHDYVWIIGVIMCRIPIFLYRNFEILIRVHG